MIAVAVCPKCVLFLLHSNAQRFCCAVVLFLLFVSSISFVAFSIRFIFFPSHLICVRCWLENSLSLLEVRFCCVFSSFFLWHLRCLTLDVIAFLSFCSILLKLVVCACFSFFLFLQYVTKWTRVSSVFFFSVWLFFLASLPVDRIKRASGWSLFLRWSQIWIFVSFFL